MTHNKRNCVAIIPARGGSKRIPKKNIKLFDGKPLISYGINAALETKLFDRVLVSTDDAEIASIAEKYGAEAPFLRPTQLADDHCVLDEVIKHALDWLEEKMNRSYRYCCMIYATAPFVTSKNITMGLEKLIHENADAAISVATSPFPAQRAYKINNRGNLKSIWPKHFNTRSQDLPSSYFDAAQFNWTHVERCHKNNGSERQEKPKKIIPLVLPRILVQDLDDFEDWSTAEIMLEVNKQKKLI